VARHRHPRYPVSLVLEGRRCLVVGGGRIAVRKAEGLLACGAVVHVVAPAVSDEMRRLPVTVEERPYQEGDVAGCWLAVAATNDHDVNATVYRDGERHHVWVNSADDPLSCSFTLPSVVRRGAITVAVSTGGRSPALATWLKGRIEADLGPEYEVLLDLLAGEREALKAAGRTTEGLAWQKALESDMLTLIRAGQVQEARERLQACLSSS
jgi:precorrin-2 dehydrogenase/sirohydrochlorin ferrochelatase